MQNSDPRQIRVLKEREFRPHILLTEAARVGLEDAENKNHGWIYYELMAIIFSALALEAFANSFWGKFIARWKTDFERKKLITKIEAICSHLKIKSDFENEERWRTVKWLVGFRNDVAHAKLEPKPIKTDEVIALSEYNFWHLHETPPSEIEKQITLENARRSVRTVEKILDQFYSKMTPEARRSLFFEDFSGRTASC